MDSLSAKMRSTSLVPRWWKRRFTAVITETDPSCKVVYLGNVLTGWAKGEGCLDKPLATLWKNYCQSNRADVSMRLSVCSSGLQATTCEHGLTEYWAHRVTWCSAPAAYPRIFAWVYRHEGRRLKQELRCHAVLCATGRQARHLAGRLEQRLREALHDFRREKLNRQTARLSVAACLYDDYSNAIPKRKLLLAPGLNNYKPPVERCKSAPKLGSIEEAPEQEDVEEEDWLRVLAQHKTKPRSAPPLVNNHNHNSSSGRCLQVVREEEPCPAANPPDAVSPNGLLDLAEVQVTLMPDGGTEFVDGPAGSGGGDECEPIRPVRSDKSRTKFGSADCVVDEAARPTSGPSTSSRRARRSLPCRAASVNDYTAELELQHKRSLVRRQSQPEYVGVARRPACEYAESHEPFLYDDDEIDLRLRLDSASAVELLLLESDSSFCSSSAEHSPNLADKGRQMLLASALDKLAEDSVSDESGYADDKDAVSSSSTASEPAHYKAPVSGGQRASYAMAEEFTLNL